MSEEDQALAIRTAHWYALVRKVTSVKHYKTVVREFFKDGKVTETRLAVLHLFTADVCERLQDPSRLWDCYRTVIQQLRAGEHLPTPASVPRLPAGPRDLITTADKLVSAAITLGVFAGIAALVEWCRR